MSTGEFVELNKENEHILVCLSSSPSNEKIITYSSKNGKRYAGTFFTALYVQTGKEKENRTKEDWKLMYNLQRNLVRKS